MERTPDDRNPLIAQPGKLRRDRVHILSEKIVALLVLPVHDRVQIDRRILNPGAVVPVSRQIARGRVPVPAHRDDRAVRRLLHRPFHRLALLSHLRQRRRIADQIEPGDRRLLSRLPLDDGKLVFPVAVVAVLAGENSRSLRLLQISHQAQRIPVRAGITEQALLPGCRSAPSGPHQAGYEKQAQRARQQKPGHSHPFFQSFSSRSGHSHISFCHIPLPSVAV